jgi:hypothetical protein
MIFVGSWRINRNQHDHKKFYLILANIAHTIVADNNSILDWDLGHYNWDFGRSLWSNVWPIGRTGQHYCLAVQNIVWLARLGILVTLSLQWICGGGHHYSCCFDFQTKSKIAPSVHLQLRLQGFYLVDQCLLPICIGIPFGA